MLEFSAPVDVVEFTISVGDLALAWPVKADGTRVTLLPNCYDPIFCGSYYEVVGRFVDYGGREVHVAFWFETELWWEFPGKAPRWRAEFEGQSAVGAAGRSTWSRATG